MRIINYFYFAYSWGDKAFPKGISPEVNVIGWLGFELQCISYYATGTSAKILFCFDSNKEVFFEKLKLYPKNLKKSSLNKEQNITTKPVISVWFILFSTFFLSCQIYQNLPFLL